MRWFFDVSKVKESSFSKSDLTDPPQIFDAHLLENTNFSPSPEIENMVCEKAIIFDLTDFCHVTLLEVRWPFILNNLKKASYSRYRRINRILEKTNQVVNQPRVTYECGQNSTNLLKSSFSHFSQNLFLIF